MFFGKNQSFGAEPIPSASGRVLISFEIRLVLVTSSVMEPFWVVFKPRASDPAAGNGWGQEKNITMLIPSKNMLP